MGFTNFPHGITSLGVPVMGGVRFSSPWATHYFVDGIDGNDGNTGKEPGRAFATIQAAVTASVGGDVIYIRPKTYTLGTGFARYTEDVVATIGTATGSGATLTNANKSLIGVTSNPGNAEYGGIRWKFATATNLTVNAPAFHVENIGFFSESATYGVLLQGNGATNTLRGTDGPSFYNCVFKGKGVTATDGGDGVLMQNCRFHCGSDGAVAQLAAVANVSPMRRFIVRNCEFQDGNGTVASDAYIDLTGVITEVLIRDCYMGQIPTGNEYITANASEGLIANIYCAGADLVLATAFNVNATLITAGIYDKIGLVVA